ncbi:hypothetical protein [Spiroplasma endosymbiont of Labia minor]|uniref:hypothetical protein n=1 Tax=Spiroplasma endosymbiont of Labia minor TaxID=3066305 RepID=UPI0030CFCFBF
MFLCKVCNLEFNEADLCHIKEHEHSEKKLIWCTSCCDKVTKFRESLKNSHYPEGLPEAMYLFFEDESNKK